MTTSGWRLGRLDQPVLAGGRLVQPVALSAEGGAQEPADLRLVLDEDDDRRTARACSRPARSQAASFSLGMGGASFTGSVKRTRDPPPGRFSAQMRPPCAWTMPWQIARPSPAPRTGRGGLGPVELLEDAPLLARRQPRAAIGDLDQHGAAGVRRRHLDRAPGRRVLERVVEQVDQHLLDQHVVHRHERQLGRHAGGDRAPREGLAEAAERGADDLLDGMPLGVELRARPTRGASSRAGSAPAGSAGRPPRAGTPAGRGGSPRRGAPRSRAGCWPRR